METLNKASTNIDGGIVPSKAKLHIRIQEVENGFIITHFKRNYGEVQYVIVEEEGVAKQINDILSSYK